MPLMTWWHLTPGSSLAPGPVRCRGLWWTPRTSGRGRGSWSSVSGGRPAHLTAFRPLCSLGSSQGYVPSFLKITGAPKSAPNREDMVLAELLLTISWQCEVLCLGQVAGATAPGS